MPVKKIYTHIFFDLDNTLWDFKENSFHAMQSAFIHVDVPKEKVTFPVFFDVYSKHNAFLWQEYRENRITKNELTKRRFKYTFDDLGVSGINPEEMNTIYLSEMPKQRKLMPGAADVLFYLRKKNYILNIITNGFKEVQNEKLLNSGIKDFFKKIYISEDIKIPKPSYEIFEYAIKSSNARKSQSLMVGDDWEVDIVGANNYGIDSVYIRSELKREQKNDGHLSKSKNKVFIVDKLQELTYIL